MPATTSEAPKAQPWKENWPPAKQTPETTGLRVMVDDSGALLIDGDVSGSEPGIWFSELACSRKETEASKAQPWRANWPPAENAATTGRKHMVDDSGALLIDGNSGGGWFSEIACSRKEAGTE